MVDKGESIVKFDYAPSSFRPRATLSAASVIFCAGANFYNRSDENDEGFQ